MKLGTFLATLVFTIYAAAASADGHSYKLGEMMIDHPHARPSIGQGKTAAAYLTIKNHGDADRLVRVESDVADKVELHTMSMTNGVMKMRPVDAIEAPAGGEAALAPGGDHVMLIGMKRKLKAGDSFPITLVFEKGGPIEVMVKVEDRKAGMDHGSHDHGSHGHGSHDHGSHSHGSHGAATE